MRGLYAIVDLGALEARGLDPVAFAEAVLAGGASALQLRAKDVDGGRQLELLLRLAPACRARGVPLFANDRLDLALLSGCDGLHVGQYDLPPEPARALAARLGQPLALGLSTHDEAQLDAALERPIDYVAIGPVFGTASKAKPDPTLGLERARALAERARSKRPDVPVVAIGGIDRERARALRGAVDAIAVIGALVPAPGESLESSRARAAELVEAFGGGAR